MHEYKQCILYKPGADLYTANWLSRQNNTENKDEEIKGIKLSIGAIKTVTDISICMSVPDIQEATWNAIYLQEMKKTSSKVDYPIEIR